VADWARRGGTGTTVAHAAAHGWFDGVDPGTADKVASAMISRHLEDTCKHRGDLAGARLLEVPPLCTFMLTLEAQWRYRDRRRISQTWVAGCQVGMGAGLYAMLQLLEEAAAREGLSAHEVCRQCALPTHSQ
jgi:hypothetical protein